MSLTIDTTKVGATGKLLSAIGPTDIMLTVSAQDAQKLAPATGAATYITVRDATNMERMLLTSVTGTTLVVTRGMDNTTPQSFRGGACISIEWNRAQLIALIENTNGTSATGLTGTFATPGVMTFVDGKLTAFAKSGGC